MILTFKMEKLMERGPAGGVNKGKGGRHTVWMVGASPFHVKQQ